MTRVLCLTIAIKKNLHLLQCRKSYKLLFCSLLLSTLIGSQLHRTVASFSQPLISKKKQKQKQPSPPKKQVSLMYCTIKKKASFLRTSECNCELLVLESMDSSQYHNSYLLIHYHSTNTWYYFESMIMPSKLCIK